jgi:hypothetical protein
MTTTERRETLDRVRQGLAGLQAAETAQHELIQWRLKAYGEILQTLQEPEAAPQPLPVPHVPTVTTSAPATPVADALDAAMQSQVFVLCHDCACRRNVEGVGEASARCALRVVLNATGWRMYKGNLYCPDCLKRLSTSSGT